MIIHCKNCDSKFTLLRDESELIGQLINCKYCNDQWIHQSKSEYLINRLDVLDQDLNKTEIQLNDKKNKDNDRVEQLENDLKIKKQELLKQKILEDRVLEFEKRITDTEKINHEQAEQEIKITQIETEIQETSLNISNKNKDIEKKTNYIEMKVSSYNPGKIKNIIDEKEKIKVNDRGVIDIKVFDKDNDKQIKLGKNKKKKKFSFFASSSIE